MFRKAPSLIICIIIFLLHQQALFAKTLHAILVADTVHDIRAITQPDLCRWQKEIRMITQHTKMVLREKIFCGSDFNKEKIKNYLTDIHVEDSDSVVFYFSGHGYRTHQKKTPWPFLTIEFYKSGLDIQWIANVIRSKKPQFALVMSDCCNNFTENGLYGQETKNIVVNLKNGPPQYTGYQQLFGKAKGCIVISSCSEGQFSYGSYLGGLYTQCFFSSLYRELREKRPSWKNLLERANGFIHHIQRPICEVYR
jgi:Caspase domain